MTHRDPHDHFVPTDFENQSGDELVIPDDLTTFTDEDLSGLHDQAVAAFDAIYNDGEPDNDESVEQLEAIATGIQAIRDEQTRRATVAAERSERAAEIAARVNPPEAEDSAEDAEAEDCEDCDDEDGRVVAEVDADTGEVTNVDNDVDTSQVPDDASEITENQPVAASARRKPVRVSMSGLRAKQSAMAAASTVNASTMTDIVQAAPELKGFAPGQGMDWSQIGKAIDRRMMGYNPSSFARAAQANRHVRQVESLAVIRRPIPQDLQVLSDDPGHVDTVIQHAVNEHRLPGGSLVASGGWCAPSETVYDLCQLESTDGMLSIPEIGINRGGIRLATGPDFSELYTDTGFCYTEDEDIDGDYDGEGGGEKPCFRVPCPEFTDYRLGLCGICVEAGLLQSRGYPEVLARVTSGVMIAHEHRMNANTINKLVAGSEAVTMPAPQAGATAPILSAIELRANAAKYPNRMARAGSFEAVFPYWVHGLIRADLSRRLGVDLIDVSDARINAWFAQRGINPQFVYDWQDFDGTETEYPSTIDFLLYPAGAWIRGVSDLISLSNVYDSTLVRTNDFTALFFEEATLVAPQCGGSQVVTVSICPNGSTNAGELIGCDGTSGGSTS